MNARHVDTNMPLKRISLDDCFPRAESYSISSGEALRNCDTGLPFKVAQKVVDRHKATKPGESLWPSFGNSQKRLDIDNVSPVLTKCGDALYSMFHHTEPRPLSINEMKRIASFPDGYKMTGDYKSVKDRIGNIAPPYSYAVLQGRSSMPFSMEKNQT